MPHRPSMDSLMSHRPQAHKTTSSLIRAEPFVYYNDIPESETAGMRDFKKLAEGQTAILPPFTIKQSIKIVFGATPIDVHIYSKSSKSRYEYHCILNAIQIIIKYQINNKIYRKIRSEYNLHLEFYKKVILKKLKKTIKVWSRRDNKLKGDCRVSQRNIRLIKSPAQIDNHPTNIEADESNWIVSEPGNIFCFTDKPFAVTILKKSQATEPALAVCFTKLQFLLDLILLLLKSKIVHHEKQCETLLKNAGIVLHCFMHDSALIDVKYTYCVAMLLKLSIREMRILCLAILYKGPGQNNGKLLASDSPNDWANGAAIVTQPNGHSFAAALTNVVGPHANVKFLAYNNVPPAVPNVKTKSNSKAASLFHAEPFVYYNDIPETETAGMPDFKKLAEGQIPTIPPFTIIRSIKLTGAGAVPVHIYSKSAKSRYESSHNPFTNDFLEIYKKVILKGLKKTIKVWSRRDNKLKGDCRVIERNIRLIKSPAQIAASLFHAEPFVYYNDIPETETAGMPDFKKLAEGQIPTIPPFTIIRSIKLTGAGAVPVHIYSKSAKSRYESSHNAFTNDFLEIYKKVILKGLKKTIKVWSRRDNKLKGDCRVIERNIRLIKSPAQIGDHATNIEADESNWIDSACYVLTAICTKYNK
ncbi:hypothetical protein T08_16025 [Trichinella sp. T8]|nr:hypothetical protein T08_16025 [Trichinella sp. T8]